MSDKIINIKDNSNNSETSDLEGNNLQRFYTIKELEKKKTIQKIDKQTSGASETEYNKLIEENPKFKQITINKNKVDELEGERFKELEAINTVKEEEKADELKLIDTKQVISFEEEYSVQHQAIYNIEKDLIENQENLEEHAKYHNLLNEKEYDLGNIKRKHTERSSAFANTDRELISVREGDKFSTIRSPFIKDLKTNNYRVLDLDTSDKHLMDYSEHSMFYKNDFFMNENLYDEYLKQEENNDKGFLKISNQDEIIFTSRLINNYLNPKTVVMPKFTKISEKERKCMEIMSYKESDIAEKTKNYYDPYPLLKFRRWYYKISSYISKFSSIIVKNQIFDNISLVVILVNSLFLLISEPQDENSIANTTDDIFLYLYTIEMFLKIFSLGFVLLDSSYLREVWNILDFTVIAFGWLSYILERSSSQGSIKGLAGLRAFRILRPLKTVKSIKGLRTLIVTLLTSMMSIGDTVLVLFFFFLIFAIAGVQMFQGLFLRRCMSINMGYILDYSVYKTMCTDDIDCKKFAKYGDDFICVKSMINPNNDVINYDNALNGLVTVFLIATMEGWTDVWNYVSATFKDSYGINKAIIFLYFHILLFVGGYYLINLYLAVIMTNFESKDNNKKTDVKKRKNLFSALTTKGKDRNRRKPKQPTKQEEIDKIKEETLFLEKNISKIPVNYNTLNNLFVLKTLAPDELYALKQRLMIETKRVLKEYKIKVKEHLLKSKMQNHIKIDLATRQSIEKDRTSVFNPSNARKKTQMLTTKYFKSLKISKKLVYQSIQETLKHLENEYNKNKENIKYEKRLSIIKKTVKRENLSFEENEDDAKNITQEKNVDNKESVTAAQHQLDNLSFLSIHSEEDDENEIRISTNEIILLKENNKTRNHQGVVKKYPLDDNKEIINSVTFPKQKNIIESYHKRIASLIENKKKNEKMKNFDIEKFLNKNNPNNTLKRHSFLEVLKHVNIDDAPIEEKDLPKDNSFDISLFHDENLIMDSKSEIDIDKDAVDIEANNDLQDEIDFDNLKYTANHNMFKRLGTMKSPAARKRNTLALSSGDFITDTPREEQSSSIKAFKGEFKDIQKKITNRRSMIKKDTIKNEEKSKLKGTPKATSVKKNLQKFPNFEYVEKIKTMDNLTGETEEEKALKLKKGYIQDYLSGYRKYMQYINNLVDKDFKIKDNFKVGEHMEDVLGEKQEIKLRKLQKAEKDPVKHFNDSKLGLKSYSYVKFLHFDIEEEEMIKITYQLKSLTTKIIESIPAKTRKDQISSRFSTTSRSELSKSSLTRSQVSGNRTNSGSGSEKVRSIGARSSLFNINHHEIEDKKQQRKAFLHKMDECVEKFNFVSFKKYFMDDEKLEKKIKEEKKKEKKKEKKNVQNFEVKEQNQKIRIYDIETNTCKYKESSFKDILALPDDTEMFQKWNKDLTKFEELQIILWKEKFLPRVWQKFRYFFYILSISQKFDLFIIIVVIANAGIMTLDGNLLDPDTLENVQISNYVFNGIFMMEFFVKFVGLGPVVYFSDLFTYLDVFIIGFAILDMATATDKAAAVTSAGNNAIANQLSFLRVLRVFRIFRVIRLAKVLRKVKAMNEILKGMTKSLNDVAYIILILVIFILIFQLLGMSLLNTTPDYQSFMTSFYATFQTLTVENWNIQLYELSAVSKPTVIFLVVWIFIGNYILFNLFISILLRSFDDFGEKNEEDIEFPEGFPDVFKKFELAEQEYRARIKKKKIKVVGEESSDSLDSEAELGKSSMIEMRNTIDDTGATLMMKKWNVMNKIFKDNECEYSLFIFSQTNKFRIWCMNFTGWKKFDQFIMFMILISTMRLILDTFISGTFAENIFDYCDIVFTLIFLGEMMLKLVANGFVMGDGTYIRDNWNRIDFIIVVVSIVDLQGLITKLSGNASNSSLGFLKVLRLLRTLRPLRFISHNVQLKLIITALFDSIEPIMNVLMVVLVVFFMFSIVGMNLFTDLYHTCYVKNKKGIAPYPDFEGIINAKNVTFLNSVATNEICSSLGGVMDSGPVFKFSNIFTSLISCYVLSNTEGWPDIMNSYRQTNDYYGIFFVLYILIVSYFFMNLFVGIMFKKFNEAWTKEKKTGITNNKTAEKYWDYLQQIDRSKPEFATFKKPDGRFRKFLFEKFNNNKYFDNFIMVVIILNMITMAMNYEGSGETFNLFLDDINYVFTGIFIFECGIKLSSNGIKGYFYYGWNQFDFFVVISSIVDICVSRTTGSNQAFLKSFQIIRVLRVLRVTRVLRLIKSLKGLEKLLQTLRWSINALINVFILMFLVFCIFAIMGCYLFDVLKYENYKDKFYYLNESYNFDNFYNSFLLSFRQVTGESWPNIMMEVANVDTNEVGAYLSYIYFMVMNFVTYVIMLNLFLLVTLEQYDEFVKKDENPIETFNDMLVSFKKAWNKYSTDKDKGFRIKSTNISNLFLDLVESDVIHPSYDEKNKNSLDKIKKYEIDLKLLKDNKNYVYFHDVLFKIIKKECGTDSAISIIKKEEEKIQKMIKKKIEVFIRDNEQSKEAIKNPLNTFNPLTSHLYFKISFIYLKTLISYYSAKANNNITKFDHNKGDISSSSSEDDKQIIKFVTIDKPGDNVTNITNSKIEKMSNSLMNRISSSQYISASEGQSMNSIDEDKLVLQENR